MDTIANHNRAKTFDVWRLSGSHEPEADDAERQQTPVQDRPVFSRAGVRRRRAHGANNNILPLRQRLLHETAENAIDKFKARHAVALIKASISGARRERKGIIHYR